MHRFRMLVYYKELEAARIEPSTARLQDTHANHHAGNASPTKPNLTSLFSIQCLRLHPNGLGRHKSNKGKRESNSEALGTEPTV